MFIQNTIKKQELLCGVSSAKKKLMSFQENIRRLHLENHTRMDSDESHIISEILLEVSEIEKLLNKIEDNYF